MITLLCGVVALVQSTRAHRLDECLHAARIAVGESRIEIELDLTPGIEMADKLLHSIDLDRDGQLSSAEGEAFADLAKNALSLKVGNQPASLAVEVDSFPALEEIKAGTGIIRLIVSAELPAFSAGTHQLLFTHGLKPEQSVYLANALQPLSKRIEIIRQERDASQREFRLVFQVR